MGTVKVITNGAALLKEFVALVSWADRIDLAFAWASTSEGSATHWNALDLDKVGRAVIGVHFNQTEPFALAALAEYGVLRVVAETSGVFHPKVVLGVKGDTARAILGSSNFTSGGYGANVELNVVIKGEMADPSISSIAAFIESQWSSPRAFAPDAEWLEKYRVSWESRPKPPPTPPPPGAPQVEASSDLNVGFDAYFDLVAAQERRTLANGAPIRVFDDAEIGSYLEEAEACRAAFVSCPSFAAMSEDARRLVAGWGRETTGFFGRMTGAGRFKTIVLETPEVVAEHLDKLPLKGKVSADLARQVVSGLLSAEGVGLGAASRLLTVKRPDLFVSVNNANKERLLAIFGSAPTTANGYVALHERLWAFPWAHAAAPADPIKKRVWTARVGLLDALLYEIPPYQR